MKPITFWGLCIAGGGLLLAAACAGPKAEAPAKAPTPTTTSAADFRTTATIKDIMDSVVDPSADFIWDSVSTIVTRKGTEERRPRTDMEWKEVRRGGAEAGERTACGDRAEPDQYLHVQTPSEDRRLQNNLI